MGDHAAGCDGESDTERKDVLLGGKSEHGKSEQDTHEWERTRASERQRATASGEQVRTDLDLKLNNNT